MTRPHTVRSAVNHLVVALLLGALGRVLLLNAPPLAEGLVLRLDEAVSLFAAMALGPLWGALASLTATLGTPQPAYSAIWALEALFVGAAVRRGGLPVLVTPAFWLLPLALLSTGIVAIPETGLDVRLLMAKQIINGTLAAALAQGLLAAPFIRVLFRRSADRAPQPLRVQIARALVPVSTIPVILLGLGLGVMNARDLTTEGTRDLATRATTTATRLADYVAAARGDVATLAGHLSEHPWEAGEIERTLLLHHAGSTTLAAMLVSDARGAVVATSSRMNSPQPQPGPKLAPVTDRAYFSEPARTGTPYLSDGLAGRAYARDPIVAVSAPYTSSSGAFAGIAQGVMNLSLLSAWLDQFVPETGASVLVLDRAGQVIASTGPAPAPLLVDGRSLPWVRATATADSGGFVEHVYARPGGQPERHVAARHDVASLGWQVHIQRPVAAMQAPLVPFYMLTAAWLLVCLLIATSLASRVSRRITQPLEMLAHTAEAIGRGHSVSQPALPRRAPAEVLSLQRDLAAMVGRLDESLALLDQKVRDRSADLAAATARSDTIFRAASDGMLVLAADGRVIEANDAFCRMLGYQHEEVLAMRLADLEPAIPGDARRRRNDQLASTGTSRFETALHTKTGSTVPTEVVVTAMPGGGGRVFAGVRDISDRRRAEAERAQLESRLRQSQKMEAIGTLAGGIAHDFNNILTLITGSADLALADVGATHPARPYLDQIHRAARRAEALVRQILAFSRRRDERRDVVAVAPIVQEAVGILRSTVAAMIEIRTEIDDRLPNVQADPVQIHQVLMNLATNSAYAMREGGGVLTIAVARDTASGAMRPGIRLTVSDTGTGMDAATLERVFEPFFTTKPLGLGTGLGLAVVHGIVTAHGGTIEAASTPGRGTTITVTMPAAPDGAAPLPAEAAVPEAASPHQRAHVLVIDDEPELVGLVCRQLIRLGYSAQGCGGPAEALEVLSQRGSRVDVVMSDLAMPKMSGIELAERIRRDHPAIAIVLCSGRVTDEDRERAMGAGIAAILDKPFATHQLAAVMERSLGVHGRQH